MNEQDKFLKFKSFTLDVRDRLVIRDGVAVYLTPKLYHLLVLLIDCEGHTLFRKTIMKDVWETDYMGDTRTLDVHIRWLRKKIEDDPNDPKYIRTVRGAGYCFIANPE